MKTKEAILQEITSLSAEVKDLERVRGRSPDFSPTDLMKLQEIQWGEGKIMALKWVILEDT